jgi:transcriptional regulator with XRE-family HTH domain
LRTDTPKIARIERGEVEEPHDETLAIIAKRLGVKADQIKTY